MNRGAGADEWMIVKSSMILLTAIVCLGWIPLHGATRECDALPMTLQEQFDTVESGLPVGWKPIVFSKIESHTAFMVLESDGGSILKAHAKASASGLAWEKEFDPHCLTEISWQWKISNVLPLGDVTRKAGDDVPARVFIMFPYDPEQAKIFTRIVYGIYKLLYGEYPPGKAIGYIWANRLPMGEVVESAYTARLKLFALKSGDELAGSWSEERRNIPADFRTAFPSEPLPRRARVAIMVDSDNTQGEAHSCFDAISLDVAVN